MSRLKFWVALCVLAFVLLCLWLRGYRFSDDLLPSDEE